MHDLDPGAPLLARRHLLSAGLSGAALASTAAGASHAPSGPSGLLTKNARVLFQGDSITDASRSREGEPQPNHQAQLGSGYAWLAAAGALALQPELELRFWNRGVSGNKVHQLAERWDADALALEPDVLSILIGVNDMWHARGDRYDGTVEVYEGDYQDLLTKTRAALPDVKLVVCEPFVLRCGVVDDTWFPEFDRYREAARRVAETHGATWVGFHGMFEQASLHAPPETWAGDGVHPTPAGAALMAQAWAAAVG